MKKIIPFLFLVVLISCSNEKENPPVTESITPIALDTLAIGKSNYFIQDLTDTNYAFANVILPRDSDNLNVQKFADVVSRNNDSLFLKCDNGKTIKFVNNRSQDDNYKLFNFIDLNKDIDHYIISCLYVESMNYLLVNKKNGNPVETIGYPAASPNKEFFACGNCDLIAAFELNGIELFKKNNVNYQSIGLRELTNWGPVNMIWKNDTTLIVKANKLKADNATEETTYKALFIK